MTDLDIRNGAALNTIGGSYFADLMQGAHVIDSGALIKDEELAWLVGVPLIVTGGTYRPGDIKDNATGKLGSYLSLTIVLADFQTLSRAKVRDPKTDQLVPLDLNGFPFDPEDTLLINDGSTGIKRQMTNYLHSRGFIRVVAPGAPLISGGSRGKSDFDKAPEEWNAIDTEKGTARKNDDGRIEYTFDLVANGSQIFSRRGLTRSEYQNEHTNEGVTYYLG
jgi:hypothetical protein